MPIVKSYWREILIAVLSAICYLEMTSKNRAEETTKEIQKQIVDIQQEADKKVRQISERNREVVVVETRPDGTIVKTVEKDQEKTKVSETISVDTNVHSDAETQTEVSKNQMERYSIGVYYSVFSATYNTDFGARLGNLPFEAVIQGNDNFHNVALGLRFKW